MKTIIDRLEKIKYSAIPKSIGYRRKQATGTSINLTDSIEGEVGIKLDGNSYQETRSGKNLLEYPYYHTTKTSNGITFTDNGDGSITINGTATEESIFWLTHGDYWEYDKDNLLYLPTGTYTISQTGNANISICADIYYESGSKYPFTRNNTSPLTITLTENATGNIRVVISKGATINNATIFPMIEQGTTATEYEQYGASPSPDYPSEVEVVKGYNLLKLSEDNDEVTTNSGNPNIGTITFNEDSYTVDTTSMIKDSGRGDWFYFSTEIGKKYTLSWSSDGNFTNVRIFCLDKTTYTQNSDNATGSMTITATENGCYFRTWTSSGKIATLNYAMVVESDIPKPYVPYQNIGVKTTGKNLFINELVTITNSTNWTLENITNGIKVTHNNSYATGSPSVTYNLKPNTTYTLSSVLGKYTGTTAYISINYGDTWKYNLDLLTANSKTFTTDDTGVLKLGFGGVSANSYVEFTNIQLEEGSVATSYEPYQENITYIDLKKNNLFDKDNADIISGYLATSTVGNLVGTLDNLNLIVREKCKPNTTYTISKIKSARLRVASYPSLVKEGQLNNGVYNDNGTNVTITTGAEDNYIYIFYWTSSGDTLTSDEILSSIKIYEGAEAEDSWEICKVGDIKDELDLTTGIFTKRIGKIVLNGSENWSLKTNPRRFDISSSTLGINNILYGTTPMENSLMQKCNRFRYIPSENWGNYYYYKNWLVISDNTSEISSLEDFKVWLSENNVIIYYPLATPYEVNLGEIEKQKTFKDVTYIDLLSTLETSIEADYCSNEVLDIDNFKITVKEI